MFSGLIEACVPVRAVEGRGEGARLILPSPADRPWEVAPGDSVACSGCCLTVAEVAPGGEMAFDLSAETLARTWFAMLRPALLLNLERSLRLSDRLGGHLVSGHVDGGATIVASEDSGDGGRLFTFEVDPGLERYLIEKGSVGLDGISLTVVAPRERRFDVAVIPLTLAETSLGTAELGQRVNVEADMLGKWVEKLLEARR